MGRKIFVSYKYADDSVQSLEWYKNSTVRDYVDRFEEKLEQSDNIYKGEHEGEDLSNLSDDEIWESLKDRIYDSSVTVVFISPNMKEYGSDRNQWIPWEISYSLKETSRRDKNGNSITSHINGMVAVVLPDENGSYSYYLEKKSCCISGCTTHYTNKLFDILRKNKFNKKNPSKSMCTTINENVWHEAEPSYIEAVRWDYFISNYASYIDRAIDRRDRADEFNIVKEV